MNSENRLNDHIEKWLEKTKRLINVWWKWTSRYQQKLFEYLVACKWATFRIELIHWTKYPVGISLFAQRAHLYRVLITFMKWKTTIFSLVHMPTKKMLDTYPHTVRMCDNHITGYRLSIGNILSQLTENLRCFVFVWSLSYSYLFSIRMNKICIRLDK